MKLVSLNKRLPPIGANVLFLVSDALNGDYWQVGEVEDAFYCTEVDRIKTKTGLSYSVRETKIRLNKHSYPYVRLADTTRVTDGKFIVLEK